MGAALRTRVTQLLGIDHPILGGGLMWLSDARYVAALVNAGCMGFITPRSFASDEAFAEAMQQELAAYGVKVQTINPGAYYTGYNETMADNPMRWLDDEVNFTKRADLMPKIYSAIHANIQDVFNEAGVEIMSPHYKTLRDGNQTTIPANYLPADYQTPPFVVKQTDKP